MAGENKETKPANVFVIENLAEGSVVARLEHDTETGLVTSFDKQGNAIALKKLKIGERAWPTQDKLRQYASPYTYCGNNPVNYIDPTGLLATLYDPETDMWGRDRFDDFSGVYIPYQDREGGASVEGYGSSESGSYENCYSLSYTGATYLIENARRPSTWTFWGISFDFMGRQFVWQSNPWDADRRAAYENMTDHERTMANPMVQIVHQGQRDFINHPATQATVHTMLFLMTGGIEGLASLGSLARAGSGIVRGGGAQSYNGLVRTAKGLYPNKAGVTELHHITPRYLGGAANGPVVPLNGSYHQQITNAFRNARGYGLEPLKNAAEVNKIMNQVYTQYPLPPGFTY